MTRRIHLPRSARPSSRLGTVAAGAALLLVLVVVPAYAQGEPARDIDVADTGSDRPNDITIEPDEGVVAEPGAVVALASESVPPDLVGQTCDMEVVAENGSSIHPGNTLITTTGTTRTAVDGVEDQADGSVVDSRSIVLGEEISLALELGRDGLSSVGFSIGFDCDPVESAEPELPPSGPVMVGPPPQLIETPPVESTPVQSPPVVPQRVESPPVEVPPAGPVLLETPPAGPTVAEPDYTG